MPTNKNVYETYLRMNAVKDQCLKNKTSNFISQSEQSTVVLNKRLDEEQTVAIVMNDADGPDNAFVYSHVDTDLQVGDYFTLNTSTTFLVYESVRIIKDVDFHKFKALECNVMINDDIPGYLVSSKQSPKDISMSNHFETSKLLPILICPHNCGLQIDDQITIRDQVWDIVECDDLSNFGINYYTIERGTNTLSKTTRMPKDKSGIAYLGTSITLSTEEGYYSSADKLIVEKRTENSITIKVPEHDFTIITLKNGKQVENFYKVKENR